MKEGSKDNDDLSHVNLSQKRKQNEQSPPKHNYNTRLMGDTNNEHLEMQVEEMEEGRKDDDDVSHVNLSRKTKTNEQSPSKHNYNTRSMGDTNNERLEMQVDNSISGE